MGKQEIPFRYCSIREAIKRLNKVGIKISYDGLQFYRKMGIIPKPIRLRGHMDKYYHYPNLYFLIKKAKTFTQPQKRLKDLRQYK